MSSDFFSTAAVRDIVPAATKASAWQNAVLGQFSDMQLGRLHVALPDGSGREFGQRGIVPEGDVAPGVASTARIQIENSAFFKKCALYGDIGFAESYLDGDWSTPDLTAVIGWFIHNIDHAPTLSGSGRAKTLAVNLLRSVNRLGHLLRPNSRDTARRNIREHYDLSNEFFALWLDPSMMYSSAKWAGSANLEEAQFAKNDALCRKLCLCPSDHALEIGTGWGGWSLHAAKHYGCRVTTLTISEKQRSMAVERIAAAGLSDRIEVRLLDYRDIQGQFDKIVSIEMLEAVGHDYLRAFAAVCDRVLKRDGLVALQFITCPDARYSQFRRGVDFIQKHIFPGSLLLAVNRLNQLFAEEGSFVLHDLEDMGRDYSRTLRVWRNNFDARLEQVKELGFDDRFIRKWRYYLSYCEAAFALRNISVVQTVHTRPNNHAL